MVRINRLGRFKPRGRLTFQADQPADTRFFDVVKEIRVARFEVENRPIAKLCQVFWAMDADAVHHRNVQFLYSRLQLKKAVRLRNGMTGYGRSRMRRILAVERAVNRPGIP